jgi:HEAT repeat protein
MNANTITRSVTLTAALLLSPLVATSWAGEPRYYNVEFLINELLYARDDDDREDAAEDLGKLGDPRALSALQQAALYDEEDDVRDEARKAIKRINRATAVVQQPATVVVEPQPVTVVRPAPVVVTPPPVVYAAPAPVIVAPPRVFCAPRIHRRVVVHRFYRRAPVLVPYGRHVGAHFSFHYRH